MSNSRIDTILPATDVHHLLENISRSYQRLIKDNTALLDENNRLSMRVKELDSLCEKESNDKKELLSVLAEVGRSRVPNVFPNVYEIRDSWDRVVPLINNTLAKFGFYRKAG